MNWCVVEGGLMSRLLDKFICIWKADCYIDLLMGILHQITGR